MKTLNLKNDFENGNYRGGVIIPNRIIKESICTSEDLNSLTPQEEVFFYRLIVNCDDYGRLDARVAILKSKLYPLKENVKSSDIERYLKKLSTIKPVSLIILYTYENIRYLQMTKWDKHQQIRAKRSKYPAYNSEGSIMISDDINGNQMIAYVPVIQSNPNPNPIRECGAESKYITVQHLSITEIEYTKLTEKFSKSVVDEKIKYAENYAKLKNYKSLYLTLDNWLRKDNIPIDTPLKEPVKLNIIYREFEER